MVKINFNTPIPYPQRDKLIHSLKAIGLSYERVYQSGTYALHRFYGRLPTCSDSKGIDFLFDSPDLQGTFYNSKDDYFEIYFLTERKKDYENQL